ncbi:hypothetical protein H0H92_004176 [Tricholoma furcatifolium]|nr:hypothetical protein H0H92_004176 [Tricholoma furcatifolium]
MTTISTSQGFIRALKASSDPPAHDGRLKIEIARQVWEDVSFHVPNKDEVVVDWILGKFLKEKDKEITLNPLLDLRYWTLLHDAISTTSSQTRPLKTWLPALLSRIPFAPTHVALLRLLGGLKASSRRPFTQVIFPCLAIIWPISAQRLNAEALLECFNAFISAYDDRAEAGDDFIYTTFVHTCLPCWLELVSLSTSEVTVPDAIYDACIETLFNLDSLRRITDSKADEILFEAIAPVCVSNSNVYTVLPRIFASYIESMKKYRGALFGQGSTLGPSAGISELQTQGMQFAASCFSLLDVDGTSNQTWSARVALLEIIDKENIFDRRNAHSTALFQRVIDLALLKVDVRNGFHLDEYCIKCFSTLARIDYDTLVPHLPYILPKLLWLPNITAVHLEFLDLILAYHSKTRTLNVYIDGLFNALLTTVAYEPHLSPQKLYQIDAWEKFDLTETTTEDRSPKRRKLDTESHDRWAVVFSASTRFAVIILSSLPWHAITGDMRSNLRATLSDVRDFARRTVKKTMKALKTGQDDGAMCLSIVSVASLRLWYALDIIGHLPVLPFDDERLCKRALEAFRGESLHPELLLELARFLLHAALHREQASSQAAFEHILVFLEKNFKTSTISWDGQSHRLLHTGMSAVALMHMILERWLPMLESFASSQQLERLVRTIMSIDLANTELSTGELRSETLLLQALHTAQLWELPRIRDIFLNFINQTISIPDDVHSHSNKTSHSSSITAYRFLLMLPVEYLPRSSRAEFSQRALTIDRHIFSSDLPPESKIGYLTVLRAFLDRTFLYSSGVELSAKHLCEALEHLTLPLMSALHNEDLENTSFSLLESLFLCVRLLHDLIV